MNKHTPGPWNFAQLEDNVVSPSSCADENVAGSIVGPDGVYIARVWQDGDNPEADALVLAAAPDLLEALRDVTAHLDYLQACGEQTINPITHQRACDAIAKATATNSDGR